MVRHVVIVKPGTRGENCEAHPCSHVCYTYQTSYQKTTDNEAFCLPAVFGCTRDIAVLLGELLGGGNYGQAVGLVGITYLKNKDFKGFDLFSRKGGKTLQSGLLIHWRVIY